MKCLHGREVGTGATRCSKRRAASGLNNTVGSARHNCRIPEHPCFYVVDLKTANLVHTRVEYLSQHSRPVGCATVWTRTGPFGRDDALDYCPIAGEPSFG
jgi:hypothetical protein